jgi:Domain of unknown function (DUF4410)
VTRSRKFLITLSALLFVPQFAFAQMPDRQQGTQPPGAQPSQEPGEPAAPRPPTTPERTRVVYITDFELDSVAAASAADSAQPASAAPQISESSAKAQHLVKLMSDNLLKDFAKAGYTAKLLRPSDPRPDDGFLITGVFTQVGPDNRLRRAVLGSHQGAETLQLYVAAQDFTHFTPPLYQTDPSDTRGANGEAAILVNPNADAARFSMGADITDKEVKQTAQKIATELVKQMDAEAKSSSDPLNRYAKP